MRKIGEGFSLSPIEFYGLSTVFRFLFRECDENASYLRAKLQLL